MILSAQAVTWLHATLEAPSPASNDLEKTYDFSHALNARRECKELTQQPQQSLVWAIRFFDQNDEPILYGELKREVFAEFPLTSEPGSRAAIAQNKLFWLADSFKKQGFARAIYEREMALYRSWGIREIHLTAVDDGLVVWIKRFGFLPVKPDLLEEDYEGWARTWQRDPTPVPPCNLPDDFLKSRDKLDLYKVL